jgi:predicted transcriptional regulator
MNSNLSFCFAVYFFKSEIRNPQSEIILTPNSSFWSATTSIEKIKMLIFILQRSKSKNKANGAKTMEVIKGVVEDPTLSPVEKVLFAILYCHRQGKECNLSIQDLVDYVGLELEKVRKSLHHLEQGGLIRIKKDCQITDASSFLTCAVLAEDLKHKDPNVPRP